MRGSSKTCNNMIDSLSIFFPGIGGAKWGWNGWLLGVVEWLVVGRALLNEVARPDRLAKVPLIRRLHGNWWLEKFGLCGSGHGGVGIGELIDIWVQGVALDMSGWCLHGTVKLMRVLLEASGRDWQRDEVGRKLLHEGAFNATALMLEARWHVGLELFLLLSLWFLFCQFL